MLPDGSVVPVTGDVVDIAVTLDVNEYKNTEYLSVIIKDIKFAGVDNRIYLDSNRLFERFCNNEKSNKR